MNPPSANPELSSPLDQAGKIPQVRARALELALVVVFLGIIGSAGAIQTAIELRRKERVQALEVFRQKPTAVNLRAFEHGLEDASVVARTLRPLFQFAQFAWLRDGGEKALVGRDGWLFYKPGYDDMLAQTASTGDAINDAVTAIMGFRDALAARGIHLLVVPAPNKESIYPDRVTGRVAPGRTLVTPSTRDLFARLESASVESVDLFTAFAEVRTNGLQPHSPALYLMQDSHWSPAGVALSADTVANRLIELGWAERGPVDYRERAAPVARVGDVLRMLNSPLLEDLAQPEDVPCVQVVRSDNAEPYQDDMQSSILILGDSFLRIYQQDEPGSAGFIAHLAKELRQPVASLVSDGGASTLVRQELFRRPALLKNKKVVIWEFVERDIRLGTEGWQPVPLPPLASTNVRSSGDESTRSSLNQSRPNSVPGGG